MGNWSDENPAFWLVDNELTVAGGIYVQALDDIELIDFVDICAMSAGDIPAWKKFINLIFKKNYNFNFYQ